MFVFDNRETRPWELQILKYAISTHGRLLCGQKWDFYRWTNSGLATSALREPFLPYYVHKTERKDPASPRGP